MAIAVGGIRSSVLQTAGSAWVAFGWVQAKQYEQAVSAALAWRDAQGNLLSVTDGVTAMDTTSGWTYIVAMGTSPANAERASMQVNVPCPNLLSAGSSLAGQAWTSNDFGQNIESTWGGVSNSLVGSDGAGVAVGSLFPGTATTSPGGVAAAPGEAFSASVVISGTQIASAAVGISWYSGSLSAGYTLISTTLGAAVTPAGQTVEVNGAVAPSGTTLAAMTVEGTTGGGTALATVAGPLPAASGDAAGTGDGSAFESTSNVGGLMLETTNLVAGPTADFTLVAWFQTTSNGGGILGFSSAQAGNGNQHDRMLWLDSAGAVHFGVFNSAGEVEASSSATFMDGKWHLAVGVCASTGSSLYVDGALQGENSSGSSADAYDGWWTIGDVDTSGWGNAPGETTCLRGALFGVGVLGVALTAAEVSSLHASATCDAYQTAMMGYSPSAYWPLGIATGGSSGEYADLTSNANTAFSAGGFFVLENAIFCVGASVLPFSIGYGLEHVLSACAVAPIDGGVLPNYCYDSQFLEVFASPSSWAMTGSRWNAGGGELGYLGTGAAADNEVALSQAVPVAPGQVWSLQCQIDATYAADAQAAVELTDQNGNVLVTLAATAGQVTTPYASYTVPASGSVTSLTIRITTATTTIASGEYLVFSGPMLTTGKQNGVLPYTMGPVYTPAGYVGSTSAEVDFSDDGGQTWVDKGGVAQVVRNALSLPLGMVSQNATINDWEAPIGKSRTYRAEVTYL